MVTESVNKHVWVSEYETCEKCNYADHRCYFCGSDLDHVGYDTDGNNHTVEFCRPDLVEHVAGPLCTWPATGDAETDALLGRPNCYWDHEKNVLKD